MDIKRWVSALVGMPLVVILLVLGNNYVVDITFAIVAGLSLHEYFNAFKGKANPVIWIRICSLWINSIYSYNSSTTRDYYSEHINSSRNYNIIFTCNTK